MVDDGTPDADSRPCPHAHEPHLNGISKCRGRVGRKPDLGLTEPDWVDDELIGLDFAGSVSAAQVVVTGKMR
jgi:hypothetical protein